MPVAMAASPQANVARFLSVRARDASGRTAVKAPQGRWRDGSIRYETRTFAALDSESDAIAEYMAAKGIGRSTRVLVMVRPGLDLITCAFALFKLGAVPLLIDPGMGLRNFLECVRRSKPEALVGIGLAHLVSGIWRRSFKSVHIRIPVGGRGWKRTLSGVADSEPGRQRELAPTAEQELAAILFTSGSTGAPKGVCYAHGMFEAQVRLIREAFAIEQGEVDLPMLPIFALFNPALGMATVVPEMNPSRPATVDPARIVQAIRQCGVTNSFGSPVLWRKICDYCAENRVGLPSLRRVLMAGAPVSPELLRKFKKLFPHAAAWTPYGATECLPLTAIEAAEVLGETQARTERGEGTCVGSPLPGNSVRIMALRDEPVAVWAEVEPLVPGEIGEIVATGPTVTREYDRLPEATARAKIREGDRIWHRMGDLGWLDEQGRLWFCGRVAERVRLGEGRFLCTEQVEPVFNRVKGVFRTALVGLRQSGREAEEPALVVELEGGRIPPAREREQWRTRLLESASGHPCAGSIRRFFFHRAFPVDVRHNAKIHRLTLRAWAEKQPSAPQQ